MRLDFKTGSFYVGDCLEIMPALAAGSVDMVLCDLPYGTTQNKWDTVIPFAPLWSCYWNALKSNGPAVLTANQPFTSILGVSQADYIRYAWVWEKEPSGNLNAKKRPMSAHEDILVFCRGMEIYNPQGLIPTLKKRKATSVSKTQNYGAQTPKDYAQENAGYPSSILSFAKERGSFHPTQKPAALFEYLIRTYTNPGELVLDNTAGSGTTAIAAIQSGRRWVCIEQNEEYASAALARIWEAEAAL